MKRRLLALTTAVSFICLIVVAAAWARSAGGAVGFERTEAQAARKWIRIEALGIVAGRIGYTRTEIVAPDASVVDFRTGWTWIDARRGRFEALWLAVLGDAGVAGFKWRTDTSGASMGWGSSPSVRSHAGLSLGCSRYCPHIGLGDAPGSGGADDVRAAAAVRSAATTFAPRPRRCPECGAAVAQPAPRAAA